MFPLRLLKPLILTYRMMTANLQDPEKNNLKMSHASKQYLACFEYFFFGGVNHVTHVQVTTPLRS